MWKVPRRWSSRLGDRYGELINDVRAILRDAAVERLGQVVETRADEFFAVFEHPRSALDAAVAIQRELRERSWADDLEVLVRIGIHSGYPTINDANYIGMAVHTDGAHLCGRTRGADPRFRAIPGRRRRGRWPTACASGVSVSTVFGACRSQWHCSSSQRRDSSRGSRSYERPRRATFLRSQVRWVEARPAADAGQMA